MNRRHTLFTLAIASVAAGSVWLGALGSAFHTSWQGSAQAQSRPTLTMGTSADYPPYEFYDTSTGEQQIVGFDIDIANYIADQLGFELEITDMDFNGLIPALQAERVDFVMAGMTPTEERLQNADFSDVYFEAQNTIIAKAGSDLETVEELSGKLVGVQLGSIQEGAAKDFVEADDSIELKALNKLPELIQEIKSGRIDAAIVEDTIAQGYVASNPDLEFNVIPTEGPSGSAVAFPKGSEWVDDFNQVLAEMEESGKMEELVLKWFDLETPAE